jgi:nicotinate-nucleotide adenylyltransferase
VSLTDAPKPHASPNYTLDTLVRLRAEFPTGGALFCLMGADSFFSLRRWHRAAEIPFVAPLIVASRPGQPLDDLRAALPQGIAMDSPPQPSRIPAPPLVLDPELRTCLLRNEAGEASPFYLLSGLHLDISASHIRDLIHHPIEHPVQAQPRIASSTTAAEPDLLPLAVLDYIRSHQLYR